MTSGVISSSLRSLMVSQGRIEFVVLDDDALGNCPLGHVTIFNAQDRAADAGMDVGTDETACLTDDLT